MGRRISEHKSHIAALLPPLIEYGTKALEKYAAKLPDFISPLTDLPVRGCVLIQKSVQFLFVMPVPDQVRDDGSGIQCQNSLKKHWIPGQARNDKNRMMRGFDNYDTALKGEVF
jgi:hypothetical protein